MTTKKELEELLKYLSSPCPNSKCVYTAENLEKCYIYCTMFEKAKKTLKSIIESLDSRKGES